MYMNDVSYLETSKEKLFAIASSFNQGIGLHIINIKQRSRKGQVLD